MKIRPVEPQDFAQWVQLWEGYNAFYKRKIAEDVTRNTWHRFLNSLERVYARVAEADGRLLGFTHFLFHPHTALAADVCYLQDLFTLESERGRGIGRALIRATYDEAKRLGSPMVYWMTHETNHTARSLYNSLADYNGFIVYRGRTS